MSSSLVPVAPREEQAYNPEADMARKQRWATIALCVLVFGFGSLAAFVPIGGAVVAGGQVSAESLVKRVTHPLGGVISEIRVKLGDHVKKGDILIRLDSTVTKPDAELTTLSVDQLLAQQARLNAERLGLAEISFPPNLLANTDPAAQKAIEEERYLFNLRRSEAAGLSAELAARIVQSRQAIVGYQAQIASLEEQLKLIAPEREGLQQLWEKKLVTINRVNQIERSASDMKGSIGALRAQIAETQARISEAREQSIRLTATRRSEAGTQLASVNAALNQQQSRKVTAGDAFERGTIRAPQDGIVDKLAFTTIGEVIRPAEAIMEIVPDRDRMLVDAAVNPADIDQVRVGQRARIRFTAFNATTTPEVTGQVAVVAPERTTDDKNQRSYYSVRIVPDAASLRAAGSVALAPGMPAEVFVETGSRSMLSYITKPLRDQFARAFRDN